MQLCLVAVRGSIHLMYSILIFFLLHSLLPTATVSLTSYPDRTHTVPKTRYEAKQIQTVKTAN